MSTFESQFPPALRPQSVSDRAAPDKAMERHYSVEQIGELWGLSTRTVRKMFEDEPGIIVFGNTGSLKKRRYLTLRIPESVLLRVHRRLRKAS
jgi:hypothetical protein